MLILPFEACVYPHRRFGVMAKRRSTSVLRTSPNTKKQKLPDAEDQVHSRPCVATQVERVFSTTELGGRILRFVPRDQLRGLRAVCKRFLVLNKYSWIQEYIDDVPPQGRVGEEVLQFCGEKIADFVSQVGMDHRVRSKIPTRLSCVRGYDGEGFLETGDAVYEDVSVEDTRCSRPCLLDSGNLVAYNLSPGHLKRIVCTLLATAWVYDLQTTVNKVPAPMQPGIFEITCDAKVVQNISWTTYCMTGKLCEPEPRTTFEATVNWAFDLLSRYSGARLNNLHRCPAARASRFKEAMILRRDHSIKRAFRVARDTCWSLEQTCLIIDRISEEHHPLYLPDSEYEDL
jgi:hypothetical protein